MKNHYKWPNISPVQHFCSGVDHANLVGSFRGSKYVFFEYELLNVLFEKMIFNIFAYKRMTGNRAHFPNWR